MTLYLKSREDSFCSFDYNPHMLSPFSTYHDCWYWMLCAKLGSALTITFQVRSTWNLTQYELWTATLWNWFLWSNLLLLLNCYFEHYFFNEHYFVHSMLVLFITGCTSLERDTGRRRNETRISSSQSGQWSIGDETYTRILERKVTNQSL